MQNGHSPSNGSAQAAFKTAPSQHPPTAFSLQEAAALLGVSLNTLRRKIATGEVQAEQVQRPQGHVWKVHLDGVQHPSTTVQQHAEQDAASTLPQRPGSTLQQPAGEIQRAEAMASFLVPLLQQAITPLVAELAETRRLLTDQAGQIGRLEMELAQAREQLALAASTSPAEPATTSAPLPVTAPEPAPWWRRWLGLTF